VSRPCSHFPEGGVAHRRGVTPGSLLSGVEGAACSEPRAAFPGGNLDEPAAVRSSRARYIAAAKIDTVVLGRVSPNLISCSVLPSRLPKPMHPCNHLPFGEPLAQAGRACDF
jgi:hypothetical protein